MKNLDFDFNLKNNTLNNIKITCYVIVNKDLNGIIKQLGFYATKKEAIEEIKLFKFYDKEAYNKVDGVYKIFKVKFDAMPKTNPIKFYGIQ